MLFHYLKVGLRNIFKYKVFSFINVFGLAAAMSISMLIILMLADQKSHDRFNVKKDRIYRAICDGPDFRNPYATSPYPLAATLRSDYPMIETATRLAMGVGGDARYAPATGGDARFAPATGGDARFAPAGATAGQPNGKTPVNSKSVEMRGYFADSAFFKVFSFELERGDKNSALIAPNTVVFTHAMARQLFGDSDPIGRTIEWVDRGLNVKGGGNATKPTPWGVYTVTGVIADEQYKSHLQFDVLMSSASMPALALDKKIRDNSADWSDYYSCFTYVVLAPGKTAKDLDAALRQLASRKYAGLKDFKGFTMMSQPLTRISPGILLGNEASIALPMMAYYFLCALAFVILLSACLNYINLSVARALIRAREIGVRKVTGALRADLVLQFLGESVLTALFALAMAIGLLFFLKSAFKQLWVNQYLNFDLRANMNIYFLFTAFALLVGIIAGVFPALHLSKFRPVLALKGGEGIRAGRLGLRKVMSVAQFVLSLFFIITSILLYNQFRHFMAFNYEFNSRNIVNIDLQSNDYRLVAKAFGSVPGIDGVSACQYLPATARSEGTGLRRADSKKGAGKEDDQQLISLPVDEHFIRNMGLKLVAGSDLPPVIASGPTSTPSSRFIVLNEMAVKAFGYRSPSAIIGQAFRNSWNDSVLIVCGVVQDFHMRMILGNDKIEPLVLQNIPANFEYVNLRIATGDIRGTIAKLEDRWKAIDPFHPLKYTFFNEELAASSQGFFDLVSIIGFVAILAVIIACLGMLGMATYTTERRRKEVGIRKVLGANDFGNALLLSREFINVLVVAICIAAPLSYILNTLWLRRFPNRVDFGWGTVLLGTSVLLLLGLLTIGSQTIYASRRNPVDSLKAE